MKDIHEVLRRKQAKYAQLSKQIEALQQAAEKLREVAPLLAENEDEKARFWLKERNRVRARRPGRDQPRAVRPRLPSLHALRAGHSHIAVCTGHKARL